MRTRLGKRILSVDKLQNIICLAYPKVVISEDDEHTTVLPLYRTVDVQPIWWLAKDGEVDFGDPWSRWDLAGREVESYECI